jgi:xanthine/uracil permease
MNTNDPKSSKGPKEQRPSEVKGGETRDTKKIDELYSYATSNREHIIAYALLAVGLLILLFFNNLYLLGGLIIGVVAGWYFAPEIIYYAKNVDQLFRGPDQSRYIVFTALLLGLLIAAPGIFIGAAIVAIFKQVFTGAKGNPPKF